MKIITGNTGSSHITSADDGGFNIATVGDADYVFDCGKKFQATAIDNNKIQLADGELCMQGRHGRIGTNETDVINIENGAQGVSRIDTIVCEYKRNGDVESMTLKAVKGTPAEKPTAPELTTGMIRDGATIHQMALFDVLLAGITVKSITPVYHLISSMAQRDSNLEQTVKDIIRSEEMARHPVGSIIMSTKNANPSTYMGFGTWVAWGSGRVPVGIDIAQDEFNGVEKTGGEKNHALTMTELASHTHSFTPKGTTSVSGNHTHTPTVSVSQNGAHAHTSPWRNRYEAGSGSGIMPTGQSGSSGNLTYTNSSGAHTHTVSVSLAASGSHTHTFVGTMDTTGSTGNGSAHNNLQPYITCYMWKRTA